VVELRHLRAFLAVVDDGSFTAAARRLGVAQSAVSQLLRTLEDHLGVLLLNRTTRSVALTPAGEQFADRLRPALAAVDGALAHVRAIATPGLLRVGFKAGGVGPLLTEVLHAYSAAHPTVQVQLTRMDWTDDLTALRLGSLDVVLARPPLDARGLHARELLSDQRVVGLPTWHTLARQTEVTLADLADEPVITGAGAPAELNDFWTVNPRPDGRAPRLGPAVRNNDEMLVHVGLGHGVCIAAATVADHHHGSDVVFRPITDLPPFPLLLLTSAGRQRDDVDAFAALSIAVAQEQAARRSARPARASDGGAGTVAPDRADSCPE
jgi:DNA-binding transcriptional LysR family regulator